MTPLEKVMFEANGGWPALMGLLIAKGVGYVLLGLLIHIGWSLV